MKCENYTYLQEQAEEYSEECSSVTPQLPQLKSNHTAKTCSEQDSETESCQISQSTETSANSMGDRGDAQLTFFAEDSPAKTSVQRVKGQELPESVRACGKSMRESLEKSGLDLSLPKTHHCFGLGGLELSSKIWPRWGMMQGGGCSELGTLVRPINGTECGCWRTPAAREPGVSVARLETKSGEPVGSMCRHYDKQTGRMAQIGLTQQVMAKATWPTPCTRDFKGVRGRAAQQRKGNPLDTLPNAVTYGGTQTPQKGQLNPSWVEWLMGWPIGWTDLRPLETDRFRNVQQWHSEFYQKD